MTGGASGGIISTLNAIIADEGAATLMKGVVPRCAFLAPLAAITLSMYEFIGKRLVAQRLDVPAADL
jgi:solute carrier family 25 S-adenosylmethionine transporter 26